MTLFNPIIDVKRTPYCGPAAVAILTGVPLSRIEKMIRRGRRNGYRNASGRRMPIKGTYASEVGRVLERLGCKVEQYKLASGTLASFVDDVRSAGTFLVEVTGHFMTCSGGMIADNSNPTPIPVGSYHKGLRQVRRAWKVIAPKMPRYTVDDPIVTTRAPKPKRDIKEVRAEKIAESIKRWERKEKLAKTKLKNLRAQMRRYERLGIQVG